MTVFFNKSGNIFIGINNTNTSVSMTDTKYRRDLIDYKISKYFQLEYILALITRLFLIIFYTYVNVLDARCNVSLIKLEKLCNDCSVSRYNLGWFIGGEILIGTPKFLRYISRQPFTWYMTFLKHLQVEKYLSQI